MTNTAKNLDQDIEAIGFFVSFSTTTDESAEAGEAERSGWWSPGEWLEDEKPDELSFQFDPDDFDEDEHECMDDAIVEWAIGILQSEGATHANVIPSIHADYWSTEGNEVVSYETGETIQKSFHFEGFSDEQVTRINEGMSE